MNLNLTTNKSETMRFTDHAGSTNFNTVSPLESTFMLADTTDMVQGFFSRPQRIYTAEWTPGVSFHHEINPWDLYFSNDKVRERLSNFAWLRCQLHVKILINSTKFYYGRLLAAYTPMHQNDNLTVFRPGAQEDFVEASQRPCVIMDPTSDQVGEMEFPFMYPKSALSVPAREWDRMGSLTIADLTVLRNANQAVDPITVTVFAYATRVDYSQPTSLVYTNEGSEYYDGPISKPAHKVARWANHLADVPVIGLYARATEMVSSTVAAVAKLFGFSRPTITNSEALYTPYYGKRLAAVNVEDTADPLSLDVKKEIPVDPRITGSGPEDPMAFVPIAKKEVYIASFDWTHAQAPDTFLFNIHAEPTQRYYEDTRTVHATPAGWIASLFRYWRGSMKIRFEVVCSSFHRGRLRLLYDPIYQATNEFNVNYTHTIDLCSENDYTLNVGWGQNLPYLEVDHYNSGNESWSSNTQFTVPRGNGIVSVYVVNSLTAPSADLTPVTVNVYVSMCDDFEVQDPCGIGLENLSFQENGIFPPSIIPANPPNNQPGDPVLEPFGPLAVYNFVNADPGNVMSLGTDLFTPGAWVLGTDFVDRTFNSPAAIFVRDLDNDAVVNDVSIRFLTNDPAPVDMSIEGILTPWTADPDNPGLFFIDYTEDFTTVAGNTLNLIFPTTASVGIAANPEPTGRRVANTTEYGPSSINWVLPPEASIQSDSFGPYIDLPPNVPLVFNNPGETLSDVFASVANPTTLSINGNDRVFQTSFPARATTNPAIEGSTFEFVNQGPDNINIYQVGIRTPVYPNEGCVFSAHDENAQMGDGHAVARNPLDVSRHQGEVPELEMKSRELSPPTDSPNPSLNAFTTYFNEGDEEIQEERPDIVESMAGTPKNLPQVSDVFFGELPSSFRQIMKRYTMIRNLNAGPLERRRFVLYANPRNTGRGQVRPADVSLWYFVMSPFLGWKGSTRHKVIGESAYDSMITMTRLCGGSIQESESLLTDNEQINLPWEGGTTAFSGHQIGEAVIPWYSNLRFRNCRIGNPDTTYEFAPAFTVGVAATDNGVTLRQLAAGGEDYQLNFWVSTPILIVFSQQ